MELHRIKKDDCMMSPIVLPVTGGGGGGVWVGG